MTSQQRRDAATSRTTLVALRTIAAVTAVTGLGVGFALSIGSPASTASNALLLVGVVAGVAAVVLSLATGALHRLSAGGMIAVAAAAVLVTVVIVDLLF